MVVPRGEIFGRAIPERFALRLPGKRWSYRQNLMQCRCNPCVLPDHKSRRRLGAGGFGVVGDFAPEANVYDRRIRWRVRNSPIIIFLGRRQDRMKCTNAAAAEKVVTSEAARMIVAFLSRVA